MFGSEKMEEIMRIKKLARSALVLALVLVMCVTMWVPASAMQFDDVKSNDWFAEAVNWAYKNWITAGKSDNIFAPKDPCTREQVVTFLWRANSSPTVNGESPFNDVRVTNYFFTPVVWAVKNGITAGTDANTFGVGQPCTRAMVVQFLYKNAGSPAVINGSSFSDVSTRDYYYDAVRWAVREKITTGTGNGRFSPNATCTRAEIVQFLYRYTKGATIVQPQDFSSAYYPVVANTLNMLQKKNFDANYVADSQDLKNAIGKATGVGTCLIDLNQDGIVELIIGDINTIKNAGNVDTRYIWVLYTVKDGHAVQLVTSSANEHFYMCSDGAVLRIYTRSDGTEAYEKMQFKNGDLYVTDCYFQDDGHRCYSSLGDDAVSFKTEDARRSSYESATRSNLGQIEYNSLTNNMKGLIDKIAYVPITAYQQ